MSKRHNSKNQNRKIRNAKTKNQNVLPITGKETAIMTPKTTLEDFIYPSQGQLFTYFSAAYKDNAYIKNGSYILVQGEAPILLLAHMDTVHTERVKTICYSSDGDVLMSPQGIGGDDRCGVYAIDKVYREAPIKPWLLFCCDEEVGCIGSQKFSKDYKTNALPMDYLMGLDGIKCMIEIDRKGSVDAVYYECANDEWEDYIASKGFVTDFGSCSDISYVAPALGVAAVNLSSGYYHQHTLHEYIVKSELEVTIEKVKSIIQDSVSDSFPRYEYVEWVDTRTYKSSDGFTLYSLYDDDNDNNTIWEKYSNREAEIIAAGVDVPYYIYEEYVELLELYSVEELEEYRKEWGDDVILDLFESEFMEDATLVQK